MTEARRLWEELIRPMSPLSAAESLLPHRTFTRTGFDRGVDAGICAAAAALGVLFLSPTLGDPNTPLTHAEVVLDLGGGVAACLLLWWRRRSPVLVACLCLVIGTLSISATAPGLLALFSLAVHRPTRPALLVAALWIPSSVAFGVYSSTTDPVSAVVLVTPLALAAVVSGMFVRGRRLLLLTLRERAERAEADQLLHEDRARMAERTRIAREMHDVLAHRISLIALHAGALEVRPDLPSAKVHESAVLLRTTARQALEELRAVVGILREEPGRGSLPPPPQPTLSDITHLVADRESAGAGIDLYMQVEDAENVPVSLGRDAYRIVQEALTNIAKHAEGAPTKVRITGAAGSGLHVSIRNEAALRASAGPALLGSGAGLLGLRERVALAGGTLVHGPDSTGDFVVEADLNW